MNEIKKVVLAYSGGLDTSVIIPWLKEHYNCEVIACTVNLGQPEDFDAIHEKALKSGASVAETLDVRREFIEEYAYKVLQAGGRYEGRYLLGTSFARPLIGKCLVDMAKKYGADAICHGATGKGNDQVRFELAVKALAPHMKIIAPWRLWDMKSREDEMAYAEAHNVPMINLMKSRRKKKKRRRNIPTPWTGTCGISPMRGMIWKIPPIRPTKICTLSPVIPKTLPISRNLLPSNLRKGNRLLSTGRKWTAWNWSIR